jgi:hypothetical protein
MKSVTTIVPIVMVIFAHAIAAQPGASRHSARIVGADCNGDNPFSHTDAFEACNNKRSINNNNNNNNELIQDK